MGIWRSSEVLEHDPALGNFRPLEQLGDQLGDQLGEVGTFQLEQQQRRQVRARDDLLLSSETRKMMEREAGGGSGGGGGGGGGEDLLETSQCSWKTLQGISSKTLTEPNVIYLYKDKY